MTNITLTDLKAKRDHAEAMYELLKKMIARIPYQPDYLDVALYSLIEDDAEELISKIDATPKERTTE